LKEKCLRGWTFVLTAVLLTGCGSRVSGTVSLVGSTAMGGMVQALTEQFAAKNPEAKVVYTPSDTNGGIEAVKTGGAEIGLASRLLKDGEKEVGLTETVVAIDGVAVIVHGDNPVENLMVEQLGVLFNGMIRDWAAVGGQEGEVVCIGRASGSGTRDRFESVTRTEGKNVLARELTDEKAVIEAVRNDPQAVGYVSLSALEGEAGVKVISVDSVPCTAETVLSGAYPIQQPFVFVVKAGEERSNAAKAFVKWAVSNAGREAIRSAGVSPLVK